MKITIKSSGFLDDDTYGLVTLIVESERFKGTGEFWANEDVFDNFVSELLKFPFESKENIIFVTDNLKLEISLLDMAGRINLHFSISDDQNSLEYDDQSAEAEMIRKLAQSLSTLDISNPNQLTWET